MKIYREHGYFNNEKGERFPLLEIIEKLKPEECEFLGGHCYEMEDYTLTSDPPISVRKCKMCGHTQYGRQQESYRWE